MYKPDNCIFTDLPKTSSKKINDVIQYTVHLPYGEVLIRIPMDAMYWHEDGFFIENRYLFAGLLLNKEWVEDTEQVITIELLKDLLSKRKFPTTPKEKADNLFQELLKLQKEDGEKVVLDAYFTLSAWKRLYFKSSNELIYYAEYLIEQKLIEAVFRNFTDGKKIVAFHITVPGLNYGIQLQSEGEKSNLCFIAMAFKPETSNIRNAIKEALIETGFKPILIDEQNINSDRTINDEIIANLKKCRFCIADFSYHSNGVYFESGFALGQGKKVIYTCLKSEFERAHFDIRPLQHIIYETAEQLKKDLKHKIEAWVI